ncbi:hypothetical protein Ade02nite_18490 [Paractinoplanes deccanensis]|uniref:Peptidase inhibitor family I36 n=1 Tax=Paractinoplanes deccanensis TaxID=113561 RepID=A0ABQ3XZM9_9ACTN|nr:peptidase inhibitor family I36 protein [Actinoplanes deccanensis]GID73208.1 hypothetical protein Ade02nite_18490 [Actinoplanes deccanensis]
MRKKLSAVAAAFVLIVAGVLVPATPALADSSCGSGFHCGWDIGFSTGKVAFFNSDADFRDNTFNTGVSVDNNIKSAKNRTSSNYVSLYLYEPNWEGDVAFCVNPGSQVENLPDIGQPGDGLGQANEASSLLLIASGPLPGCY